MGYILDCWILITLLGIEDVVVSRPIEQVKSRGGALREIVVDWSVSFPSVQVNNTDSYSGSSSQA